MTDGLKKRGAGLEGNYFHKKNLEALAGLTQQESVRKSPITGKAMQTLMYKGVEIDVCEDSGGIWLDQGELEKIIENTETEDKTWVDSLKALISGE